MPTMLMSVETTICNTIEEKINYAMLSMGEKNYGDYLGLTSFTSLIEDQIEE